MVVNQGNALSNGVPGNPVQGYQIPWRYIHGLELSILDGNLISIAVGQARDESNIMDMPVGDPNYVGITTPEADAIDPNANAPLIIDANKVGVPNGISEGSLLPDSFYIVYLIGDAKFENPTAGLLSTGTNAFTEPPLLPVGYNTFRAIGFCKTDSNGDLDIVMPTTQLVKEGKTFFNPSNTPSLSGGNATSFTGVDLHSACPLGDLPNVVIQVLVTFIPSSSASYAQFRPTGSTFPNAVTFGAYSGGSPVVQRMELLCGVNASNHTSIDYKVSSAADSLSFTVVGFTGFPRRSYPV